MEIVINTEDTVPLFQQVVDQIKTLVQANELKPGDPLPSIRRLAKDLGINPNTVAKAFRTLERDSVIQTRGYRGTCIHENAKANSKVDLKEWLRNDLAKTITRYRSAGISDSEIRIALGQVMKPEILGDGNAN